MVTGEADQPATYNPAPPLASLSNKSLWSACAQEDRKEQLKRSGLGKVVMFLFKLPGKAYSLNLSSLAPLHTCQQSPSVSRGPAGPTFFPTPPDETPANRKIAKELIERWSRPILVSTRRSIDHEEMERILQSRQQRQRALSGSVGKQVGCRVGARWKGRSRGKEGEVRMGEGL